MRRQEATWKVQGALVYTTAPKQTRTDEGGVLFSVDPARDPSERRSLEQWVYTRESVFLTRDGTQHLAAPTVQYYAFDHGTTDSTQDVTHPPSDIPEQAEQIGNTSLKRMQWMWGGISAVFFAISQYNMWPNCRNAPCRYPPRRFGMCIGVLDDPQCHVVGR